MKVPKTHLKNIVRHLKLAFNAFQRRCDGVSVRHGKVAVLDVRNPSGRRGEAETLNRNCMFAVPPARTPCICFYCLGALYVLQ